MRCQCCRKVPATIHIRDTAEWRTQSHVVVCDECIRYLLPHLSVEDGSPVPIEKALRRARRTRESTVEKVVDGVEITVEDVISAPIAAIAEEKVPDCPTCGLTFSDFRKEGRMGCGDCYDAFSEPLEMLLFRVHGDAEGKHVGRRPGEPAADSRGGRRAEIQQLKRQMLAAVEAEAYERAAELRDRIGQLEADLGTSVASRGSEA
jgi:protein arginine kinase activator